MIYNNNPAYYVFLLWLLVNIGACTTIPGIQSRNDNAEKIASSSQWHKINIVTNDAFDMVAFVPDTLQQSDILTIYIEGDGFAWQNRRELSSNPTPIDPVGLKMAIKDVSGHAVYMARPCQYQYVDPDQSIKFDMQPSCTPEYWSSRRFAPEIISSANVAASRLKTLRGAKTLRLVGYSGGGAVAALIAARRNDVEELITLAGNLDHEAWTKMHHIMPLSGSLNPVDDWRKLMDIPQTHYVGSDDKIIPIGVYESYAAHFPADKKPGLVIVKGNDHHCCWSDMSGLDQIR